MGNLTPQSHSESPAPVKPASDAVSLRPTCEIPLVGGDCEPVLVYLNGDLYEQAPSGTTVNIEVNNEPVTITSNDIEVTTVAPSGVFEIPQISFSVGVPTFPVEVIYPQQADMVMVVRFIAFHDDLDVASFSLFKMKAEVLGTSTATNRSYKMIANIRDIIEVINATGAVAISAFVDSFVNNAGVDFDSAMQTAICPVFTDVNVSVNSIPYDTGGSGDSIDVVVQYENGTPTGSLVGSVWTIANPVTQSGIAYKRPNYSQYNSYTVAGAIDNAALSYDEGWHVRNGTYSYTPPAYPLAFARLDLTAVDPFLTLVDNNAFGNKNRWTAADGTQIYPDSYRVCNLTGLGWWTAEVNGLASWTAHLAYAASATEGGYSDWRMPTNEELKTIMWENGSGWPAVLSGLTTNQLWTCTTNPDSLSQAISTFSTKYFTRAAKTTSYRMIMVRNHF